MRDGSGGIETHLFCRRWFRRPGRLEQQQQEEVMEVRRSWTDLLTPATYQETNTLLSPPIPRDKTAALPLLLLRPRLSHAL